MKIIIPGIPVSQARMRHSQAAGFVTTYDPRAKEKREIKGFLKCKAALHSFQFPRISFLFHMPIPKGIRKREVELYNSGTLKHDKKPDVDNLIKLYLDCLDGIFLQGDQKVSLGPCLKVYHPEPKTIIWMHETTHKLTPWELDVPFLCAEQPDIPSFSLQDYPYGSYDLWTQVASLFLRNSDHLDAIEPLERPVLPLSFQELEDMVFHENDSLAYEAEVYGDL